MVTGDPSKLQIDSRLRQTSSGSRRRRTRWLGILASIVLAILGVSAWFGLLSSPVEVRVVKVSPLFVSRALTNLNASGYVVAQRKAAVSSKATGRLSKLYVEEGKSVKDGAILAQLENEDLKAIMDEAEFALKVARAALDNADAEFHDAELQYDRQKVLRESGSVSVQSFDSAEARYKKAVALRTSARFAVDRAEASVRIAEVNLEYSFIRAPFDGVILTKNADIGEVVAPFGASVNAKAAVVTMADMSSLMVEVDVAESGLGKVAVGGAAEIRLDAFPGERFPGNVYMIVPTADRAKATVLTKVRFDRLDERVLPEMSAKVAFLERPLKKDEHGPVLAVPLTAVNRSTGATTVFRVQEGKAYSVPVKVGREWGEWTEIISGLKEGDLVVLAADTPKLKNAVGVKIPE